MPDEPSMSEERITRFLDQFPEDLVLPMLKVLDGVRFLTRDDLGKKLVSSLNRDGSSEVDAELGAFLFTTDPHKSAATLGGYFADSNPRPRLDRDVVDALAAVRAGRVARLAWIEDFCLSGQQAGTVVQRWMGLSPLLLPDEADIADQLSDEDKELLRQTPISLRFVFSTDTGRSQLARICEEAGLMFDIASVLSPADVKTFDELAGQDADGLRAFLTDVGTALLSTTKGASNPDKWTVHRIEHCALGYGNEALLVLQQNNCPTATVTALWSQGSYRGVPWLPLFSRRSTDL